MNLNWIDKFIKIFKLKISSIYYWSKFASKFQQNVPSWNDFLKRKSQNAIISSCFHGTRVYDLDVISGEKSVIAIRPKTLPPSRIDLVNVSNELSRIKRNFSFVGGLVIIEGHGTETVFGATVHRWFLTRLFTIVDIFTGPSWWGYVWKFCEINFEG